MKHRCYACIASITAYVGHSMGNYQVLLISVLPEQEQGLLLNPLHTDSEFVNPLLR